MSAPTNSCPPSTLPPGPLCVRWFPVAPLSYLQTADGTYAAYYISPKNAGHLRAGVFFFMEISQVPGTVWGHLDAPQAFVLVVLGIVVEKRLAASLRGGGQLQDLEAAGHPGQRGWTLIPEPSSPAGPGSSVNFLSLTTKNVAPRIQRNQHHRNGEELGSGVCPSALGEVQLPSAPPSLFPWGWLGREPHPRAGSAYACWRTPAHPASVAPPPTQPLCARR